MMDEELPRLDDDVADQSRKDLEAWRKVMALDGGVTRLPASNPGQPPTRVTHTHVNFNGVVVGPGDVLVLTLRPDHDLPPDEVAAVADALAKAGVDSARLVMLKGLDATVVKGPPDNATPAGTVDKVNDPLPVPPGYRVKAEKIDNARDLLISYEKDALEVNTPPAGPGNATRVSKERWLGLPCFDESEPAGAFSEKEVRPEPGAAPTPSPPELTELTDGSFTGPFAPPPAGKDPPEPIDPPLPLTPSGFEVRLPPARPCGHCNGTGVVNQRDGKKVVLKDPCPVCGGRGSR